MLFFCSLLPFLFVELVTGITITSQSTQDQFPVQFPNHENPRTFFRITKGTEVEQVWCPQGYVFDGEEQFCVKQRQKQEKSVDSKKPCSSLGIPAGLWPNPNNCETFFNCGPVCCDLMSCPSHLLFNAATKRCDFPRDAKCCEYEEKNPELLVQTLSY